MIWTLPHHRLVSASTSVIRENHFTVLVINPLNRLLNFSRRSCSKSCDSKSNVLHRAIRGFFLLISTLMFAVMHLIAFSFDLTNSSLIFSRFLFRFSFVFNVNMWKELSLLVSSILAHMFIFLSICKGSIISQFFIPSNYRSFSTFS